MTANRRRFLQSLAAVPGAASLSGFAPAGERDVYKELGVRPLINAAGTYTYLSASRMPREVMEAMDAASRQYVNLNELHQAVGRRIAELLGWDAALVTSGAAAALLLGTAACVAGTDREKIRRLPDTEGMKNEVILQKAHRNGYDHLVRAAGARLVEVETAEDVERAAGPRTACLLFFNVHEPEGKIKAAEFAALAKKLGVPAFVDAAADVPPVETYARFRTLGYDLAAFSGGKALRGPQCSGFLLGRKDLVAAAAANGSPNTDVIGRASKIGKEEIVGVWAALERFLREDPKARWREWEARCEAIAALVAPAKAEVFVPPIANAVPHLRVACAKPEEVVKRLREGEPRIEIRAPLADAVEVAVWMLDPGEAEIVGRRLREVL
ncbi:MAG TPA: aminotransferase class V-fold PLP-dependent enzyme [Planctomycetota bacterium]